jgi:hypothetical protein
MTAFPYDDDYDRPSTPTYYKGTLMDSEHEARWAAMLSDDDFMGWPYVYHPVCFNKHPPSVERYTSQPIEQRLWLPDGGLRSPFTRKAVALVEIKHFTLWEQFEKTVRKVQNAIDKCNPSKHCYRRVLYLGGNNRVVFGNGEAIKDPQWVAEVDNIAGQLYGKNSLWEKTKEEITMEQDARRELAEGMGHDFTDSDGQPQDYCNGCRIQLNDPKAEQPC